MPFGCSPSGSVSDYKGVDRCAIGGKGTARVKAEPPEPEKPCSQDNEGYVVGLHGLSLEAQSSSKDESSS